jgi:hypothetical protein
LLSFKKKGVNVAVVENVQRDNKIIIDYDEEVVSMMMLLINK